MLSIHSKPFALFSGLLSAFVFVLMGFYVKKYGDGRTTTEIAAARALFVMVVLFPFCFRNVVKKSTLTNKTLWLRCIFGGFGILILMWLLKSTTLTIARTLYFLMAPFTAILGSYLLKERLSFSQSFGGLITILFCVFPVLFPHEHIQSSDLSFKILTVGILGAITAALAQISLRKTVTTEKISPATIVFFLCFTNLVFCLIYQPNVLSQILHWELWPLYLSVGLTGLIAQITLTWSYIPLTATVASYLSLTSFAWTILIDYVHFKQMPTSIDLVAVTGVITGIYLLQRK